MKTIRFTIDGHLPSRANERGHWAVRARLTRSQRRSGYVCTKDVIGTRDVEFPVTVTMTRISPRLLDNDDNLNAAFKNIRDGIADALGCDDSPRSPIAWKYDQRKGKPPCAEITIQEANYERIEGSR